MIKKLITCAVLTASVAQIANAQFHYTPSLPFGCITKVLEQGSTLYAATESQRVYFSNDNGNNWNILGKSTFGALGTNDMTVNPTGNILVAQPSGGIKWWNGTVWTPINSGLPTFGGSYPFFQCIESDHGGVYYAGAIDHALQQGGLFQYNGSSWVTLETGLTDTDVRALAINAQDNVYCGTLHGGVFKLSGSTWTPMNTGIGSLKIVSLEFSPDNVLFAGTSNGIYYYDTTATSWVGINSGLPNKDIQCISFDNADPLTIYAGLGFEKDTLGDILGDVYKTTDGGLTWTDIYNPTTGRIKSICLAQTGDLFAAGYGIYKSADNGVTWSQDHHTGIQCGLQFSKMTVNDNGDIFLGTDNGIYTSVDYGVNWSFISQGLLGTYVTALEYNPHDGNLYSATKSKYGIVAAEGGSKVYRSSDNGATWQVLNAIPDDQWFTDFAFSPTGEIYCSHGFGSAFATIPGSVVSVSSDAGNTWTSLALSGGTVGAAFSVDINSLGHIFVATETQGICRSTDGGNTFTLALTPGGNSGPVVVSGNNDIWCGEQGQYGAHYSDAASNGNTFINLQPANLSQYKSIYDYVFDSYGNTYVACGTNTGYHGLVKLTPPVVLNMTSTTVDPKFANNPVLDLSWTPCGYLAAMTINNIVISDVPLTSTTFGACTPQVAADSFSVFPKIMYLGVGETALINGAFQPTNVSNQMVDWISGNTAVATVGINSGNLTGIGIGTTIVNGTSVQSGLTDSCIVHVVPTNIHVTGMMLNYHTYSLNLSQSFQLTALISPLNASNQNVQWTTSNSSVLSVDQSGNVTGLATGTATVFAMTYDGFYEDSCLVTVTTSAGLSDSDASTIRVFPNPVVSEKLFVQTSSSLVGYAIFNVLGELQMSGTLSSELNYIDVGQLKSGTYILLVYTNGSTESFKLVK